MKTVNRTPLDVQAAYPPINEQTHEVLNIAETSWYLRMAKQTLRIWACTGKGPITPLKIGGRLHWRTSDVKKLLGVE